MSETWILHVDSRNFQGLSLCLVANPKSKRRAVRMRNCRAPRCRVRDVTRTRAGVTDETLSRKSLARVQDTACKKAQVSSARTSRAWRHTNTFRYHGYNALANAPADDSYLLRSIGHTFATEEVEKVGKVEYRGSVRALRSLPNQVGNGCKVWLRSVQKCKFV
jgi:hypothetical protein